MVTFNHTNHNNNILIYNHKTPQSSRHNSFNLTSSKKHKNMILNTVNKMFHNNRSIQQVTPYDETIITTNNDDNNNNLEALISFKQIAEKYKPNDMFFDCDLQKSYTSALVEYNLITENINQQLQQTNNDITKYK
jgi:hypothetical protein